MPGPPPDAYQGWAYDALSQSKYPVYRAKIMTAKGCFAEISDLDSYSAEFR
jgi:hypothetical protein